jgi:hypothetical protein
MISRLGTTPSSSFLSLRFLLSVPPNFNHSFAVTTHAIDPLGGLCENELVDPVFTNFTFETVGVIRVVACHDGLVEDWEMTNITAIRAIRTYRGAVREKEQVGVGCDLVPTFGTFEAIDMEE